MYAVVEHTRSDTQTYTNMHTKSHYPFPVLVVFQRFCLCLCLCLWCLCPCLLGFFSIVCVSSNEGNNNICSPATCTCCAFDADDVFSTCSIREEDERMTHDPAHVYNNRCRGAHTYATRAMFMMSSASIIREQER